MKPCDEYLRRNIVMANACGLKAEVEICQKRLGAMKRVPKWLRKSFEEMQTRAAVLPQELAQWRDIAPDNPYTTTPPAIAAGEKERA